MAGTGENVADYTKRIVADEVARRRERDESIAVEPRPIAPVAIGLSSQRAEDILKQATFIGSQQPKGTFRREA